VQLLNRRIAFPPVARGYNDDQGLVQRPRLEKFIDQARPDAETEAAAYRLGKWAAWAIEESTYLFAPVMRAKKRFSGRVMSSGRAMVMGRIAFPSSQHSLQCLAGPILFFWITCWKGGQANQVRRPKSQIQISSHWPQFVLHHPFQRPNAECGRVSLVSY